MLSPYRVLDLSDERGQLAGLLLAQMGAEVIAVEPPGGSRSRRLGPFAGDVVDPDLSLQHWAFNRGKRSVVLDLADSAEDREQLRRLAAGADVLVESSTPGTMESLGLRYEELAAINPALVYCSITPFGQTGPKARWAATDLTVWAAAGPLVLTGDADRAPVHIGVPQAFAHGAAEAAGAIVAALYERGTSGLGQHLDVSAQQAAAQATMSAILAAPNESELISRESGGLNAGPIRVQLMWPCADGHVSVTLLFGDGFGAATKRLMTVVCEEGFCDEATRDKDWVGYFLLLFGGEEPLEEYERVKGVVGAFCAAHTKAELLQLALERQLLIAPVNSVADVVSLDQLASRGYWETTDGVTYPGPIVRASAAPLSPLGTPPRVGEHTASVLAEPARQPATGAGGIAPSEASEQGPLAGLRVLDFMWVMAGPAGTRVLADLGATVIRIESSRRFDALRGISPYKKNEPGADSVPYNNLNAGKLGMALDPGTPEGRAVIHDLVRWADVVTESFSPKAMKAWGLDYDSLREINPSIVMLSSCLFGQTGPLSTFAGYGTMAAAMCGFFGVTGWADRAPCGPYAAYTDYISPRFANVALLSALDHRRRTGQGQYLDYAQAEGSLHTLAPAVLDYTVNARIWERRGNEDLHHHPHGVYPAAGEDEWVAIACADDAQRAALTGLAGGLDDEAIVAWTSSRSPDEAAIELQAAGVAAHRVQTSPAAAADLQLIHRNHFITVDHSTLGAMVLEGPRVKYSRTPATTTAAGPTIGQHTPDVLTNILGYDDERFTEVLVSGALE